MDASDAAGSGGGRDGRRLWATQRQSHAGRSRQPIDRGGIRLDVVVSKKDGCGLAACLLPRVLLWTSGGLCYRSWRPRLRRSVAVAWRLRSTPSHWLARGSVPRPSQSLMHKIGLRLVVVASSVLSRRGCIGTWEHEAFSVAGRPFHPHGRGFAPQARNSILHMLARCKVYCKIVRAHMHMNPG